RGQRKLFLHLHEIDAAGLEHGAVAEIDLMHDQVGVEAIAYARAGAGQETRAQAVGDVTKPEIDAGGLDLIIEERRVGDDPALLDRPLDFAVRQYAVLRRHGATCWRALGGLSIIAHAPMSNPANPNAMMPAPLATLSVSKACGAANNRRAPTPPRASRS